MLQRKTRTLEPGFGKKDVFSIDLDFDWVVHGIDRLSGSMALHGCTVIWGADTGVRV